MVSLRKYCYTALPSSGYSLDGADATSYSRNSRSLQMWLPYCAILFLSLLWISWSKTTTAKDALDPTIYSQLVCYVQWAYETWLMTLSTKRTTKNKMDRRFPMSLEKYWTESDQGDGEGDVEMEDHQSYRCHGLSLLELTLHWTRYWPISLSHRSFSVLPWLRSSIWLFPSCLASQNI